MRSTVPGAVQAPYIEAIIISPCRHALLICKDAQLLRHFYGPTVDMAVPYLLSSMLYLPDETVLT